MASDSTQTPANENAKAEPQEQGSDMDAAAAAFATTLEEQKDTPPEDEPEADADAEPDEGETDDAESEDALVEVEIEGKTYKVPPEVQKATLRQADYSRQMNAVAAEKKALAQQKETAEQLLEGADKFAKALAEVNSLDAQLKEFESVDWKGLRARDGGEYSALSTDHNTARLNREDAVRRAQAVHAEIVEAKHRQEVARVADRETVLQKELKGWGEQMGTAITQHCLALGWSLEKVARMDAHDVMQAHKAMKYDALQKGKSDLKAKVRDIPPVLKPGTTRRSEPQAEAMAKLRKDNSLDSAAAAFRAFT